jgi:hypothetical protein
MVRSVQIEVHIKKYSFLQKIISFEYFYIVNHNDKKIILKNGPNFSTMDGVRHFHKMKFF